MATRITMGLALALSFALTAPAGAASCTVGDAGAGCATLTDALATADANPGEDIVRLPEGPVAGAGAAYTSPDRLDLIGAGVDSSVVQGPLVLDGANVVARGFTLRVGATRGISASGSLRTVRITGAGGGNGSAVRALPGAPLVLDDVLIDATALDAALDAPCASLTGRHLTVVGAGAVGARADCGGPGGSRLSLDSSIVADGFPRALEQGADDEVSATFSHLDGAVEGRVEDRVAGPPGFVSDTDFRLAPSSPLVERGNPAPLVVDRPAGGVIDASEPLEDLDGGVRASDADADGRARRDVGAYEIQAGPFPAPQGNVLANPDAEAGDDGAVPGWTLSGGFETVPYGRSPFPSLAAGGALGGGRRFFSGGADGDASASQAIDLSSQAAAVDGGGGRVTLSGLLGGYRADADGVEVEAAFLGPSGVTLGMIELGGVDADARANATTLLSRSVTGAIPALTRSVEVTLRATKGPDGAYADAYFDNLGLTLALPPAPDPPPGGGGGGGTDPPGPRPFAGIAVLAGSATLSRTTGTAKVLIGCATATVARCTGDLALEAVLVRKQPRVTIGRGRFSLAPGGSRRVTIRLSSAARRYLGRHTLLRVRVGTTAVDGQGVRRATTAPIVVRPQKPARRKPAAKRSALAPH